MLEKYVFSGHKEGKKLIVLAAIHGNETAGTNAIKRLVKEFDEGKYTLTAGKLTLVPVCNVEAYEIGVRQIDENLNRVMIMHDNPQTYEQTLANEICPLIKENDVLLDLHSTHCEGDVPFVICDYPDDINNKFINRLPIGYVLYGWPDVYAHQKEIEDYCTERCAHMSGCSAITLECGYYKAKEAIDIAYQSIVRTLSVLEMIAPIETAISVQKKILIKNYVTKLRGGCLLKPYVHLDKVKKDEPIARYNDGEILYAESNGYILLPNSVADIGTEWYYFGQDILS